MIVAVSEIVETASIIMSTSDHVSEKHTLDQENHPEKENGVQENNHVSMSDFMNGTVAQELTPFERKAALVNALVLPVSDFLMNRYSSVLTI